MSFSPMLVCASCPTRKNGQANQVGPYPSSVTDDHWVLLEPMLPPPGNQGGKGGRAEKDCRCIGLCRARRDRVGDGAGGIPAVPDHLRLPPRRPSRGSTTCPVIASACATVGPRVPQWRLSTRSRCKVRTAIASATRGYDAGKKVNGRKRHIATDTSGLLLAVMVTVASVQDRDGGLRMLAAVRAKFSTIMLLRVDRGCTGRSGRVGQKGSRTDDSSGQTHRWHVRLPRPAVAQGCGKNLRLDPQAPPMRPRLRTPTQPPRSMVYLAMIFTLSRRLGHIVSKCLLRSRIDASFVCFIFPFAGCLSCRGQPLGLPWLGVVMPSGAVVAWAGIVIGGDLFGDGPAEFGCDMKQLNGFR